jgi:hypothetical protein
MSVFHSQGERKIVDTRTEMALQSSLIVESLADDCCNDRGNDCR